MATESRKESLLTTVKMWVFPSLVTVLSLMIWRDINEMRTDIKSLLAQTNIDKTKIENLEREVRILDQAVFNKKVLTSYNNISLYERLYFKHEDFYNLEDYLPKKL